MTCSSTSGDLAMRLKIGMRYGGGSLATKAIFSIVDSKFIQSNGGGRQYAMHATVRRAGAGHGQFKTRPSYARGTSFFRFPGWRPRGAAAGGGGGARGGGGGRGPGARRGPGAA